MALPKLNNAPSYEMVIPSSGKTVRFRPFLVKEQKALMIAAETNEPRVMFRSVLDLLLGCIDDKVYHSQLTSFDVEYMFLQIRSKSVGESANIALKCEECKEPNEISINLEELKVDGESKAKIIELTDDIKVELNYPAYTDMIDAGIGEDGNITAEQMFDIIHSCIRSVETPDERIDMKDVDKKEIQEFIESMSGDQFKQVQEFIMNIPRLSTTVKFKCKSCEHDNEMLIEGIASFL